jgi:hypothetical protein
LYQVYAAFDSAFISKAKGAILLTQEDYSNTNHVMRLKYADYDYTTHFQLPVLTTTIPGMKKHVKVR